MAYSTINKHTDYFNTILWTGNTSTTRSFTGVGFQPDWVWGKQRNTARGHQLMDSVRGANKTLESHSTNAEGNQFSNGYLTSFDSDGFSATQGSSAFVNFNENSGTYAAWNWLAGGTAPTITYTVKVVSDSGNKYRFDDFGTSAVTLDLQEGGTYTFDQSDSSNSGHPLRFSTTSDGSHGGGSEYTTGVTTTGTPGSSGAKTVITVASGAATLYYYCTQHSGMGGQANTNSTFGSSNFSGSVQSTVSANTTAGFSIFKWTGTGSGEVSIGHGFSTAPKMWFVKSLSSGQWFVYTTVIDGSLDYLFLHAQDAKSDSSATSPSNSVIYGISNTNQSEDYICYAFKEVKGYSKFGTYGGTGNANGPFIYTGFKPAFVILKVSSDTNDWTMFDNKRPGSNVTNQALLPNQNNAESTDHAIDFLSNGFKIRDNDGTVNPSGQTMLYMAFGQTIVGSNNVPATAR